MMKDEGLQEGRRRTPWHEKVVDWWKNGRRLSGLIEFTLVNYWKQDICVGRLNEAVQQQGNDTVMRGSTGLGMEILMKGV